MIGFALVLVGAAIGAPARYLLDRSIQARHESLMPWGTMSVNLAGSAVLGLLGGLAAEHAIPHNLLLLIGTGLSGSFTTFSTYSYETMRLYQTRARTQALLNLAVTITAGLGTVIIGYAIGTGL